MSRTRAFLLLLAIVVAGVAGTLVVGAAVGMGAADLRALVIAIVPAALVTIVLVSVLPPVLARSTLGSRFVVVSVTATVIALGNVVALTLSMAVSAHDASLVAALLVYGASTGVGAAWLAARDVRSSLDRITETTVRIRDGDLSARVGAVPGGRDIDRLATTIDSMTAELEASREREHRVEEIRRNLISAVSHDLRTPLSSLRAMIEAIDERVVSDPPTLERYAVELRRSVEQLGSMVDDLFELVQVDAGVIEVEEVRVQLEEVIDAAIDTVRHDVAEKRLRVVADLGDAGRATCSPRVTRVLQTLLVNAVRHTPADGTIRVEARRRPTVIELAVEDDGEGIAQADLPRVFEPFFRADGARSGAGAGLGLALAQRIVEALGGTIDARSADSRGARFEIALPL